MKNKYFYQIFKLKIKPWLKYWLIKQTEFKGVLSDILEGISFYLTDSLNMKFKMFKIYGRTVQDGDPTPENPVPIKNTGDNGSVNENVSNSDGTQEQNISFPLAEGQKLMEGDYLADDGVHHVRGEKELLAEDVGGNYRADISTEYHCVYFNINNLDSSKSAMCNYFKRAYGSTYNQTDNSFYSFSNNYVYISIARSIIGATAESTAAECQQLFKDWLTSKKQNGNPIILNYPLLTEVIEPYTEEQQTAWEEIKKARTYKNITHISSEDETPAELKIQYWKEG